jgi:adenosylcobinamide-GDP ribazoletransferase
VTGEGGPGLGVRAVVAMFSALPVPRSWHGSATPDSARTAMRWLPLLGMLLGAVAGLPAAAALARAPQDRLLAAVLGVCVLALLTRGLHLDGLADTADGLGSRAPAARALEIMRQSDIGPFGVVALVLVLVLDVVALSDAGTSHLWGMGAALLVAAATARLAAVHASTRHVPAASTGFGALVAGSVSNVAALLMTVVTLAVGSLAGTLLGAGPFAWPLAQAGALIVAFGCRVHVSRRLGGVSGDVFGALIEVVTALTLVGLALAT